MEEFANKVTDTLSRGVELGADNMEILYIVLVILAILVLFKMLVR